LKVVTDTKDWIQNMQKDVKEKEVEKQERRENGETLSDEEKKIARMNEQLGIISEVETGVELVFKFLPKSFTGGTLAQDLRQGASCALGIATATATGFIPTTTASALNTCISWVGNMVLRRLKRLDLAANNRLKRQRFAGAPQTSFLNALRFTRSYTKELMAIVRKADSAVAGESKKVQEENSEHHRFSPVTRDVLSQTLCGVSAMNKYFSFIRAADSLCEGENTDTERIEAENFAMTLAEGFQRDLSRALQLEQLKLTFDIARDLDEYTDDVVMEGAADDDEDDEELPEANLGALNAWRRLDDEMKTKKKEGEL
jgi:hypothetical protein